MVGTVTHCVVGRMEHHFRLHYHHCSKREKSHRKLPNMIDSWLVVLVCVVCLVNPVLSEVIYRVDPLALLAATLRTYQRAGCDSEQLSLSCPRGTSISIELAQYGRAGDLTDHSLCPPVPQEDFTTTGIASDGVIHSGTEIEVKPPETCTVSGLQYALLQTVVDACQKKRHCKFAANSKTHTNGDPCSNIRKFVEIAYKCRPYEFRSKVACENDNMPLVCNPYSRIAIYSASFGHTESETVQQCGHGKAPVSNEDSGKPSCLVSYATETVMQICHGRRRCSVTADAGTFGRPCKNDIRMYLKVVYTCIPRKVLKDRYDTAPEADEPQQAELDMDHDMLYEEDQFYKESEAIPPAPKLQGAIPNPVSIDFVPNNEETTSSTLLPPLLSRKDGSIEEVLQSSALLLNRIKASLNQETTTLSGGFSNVFVTTTPNGNGYDDDLNEVKHTNTDIDEDADTGFKGNFFYKEKCQMVDDWGPIGLNCTEEDIIKERVEVTGFLVNWMQSYQHIRNHQEQFFLYLIISVAAGVLLFLTLVIGRLTIHKRRVGRKNSNTGNLDKAFCEALPASGAGGEDNASNFRQTATGEHRMSSFDDDISDIDGDLDLARPVPSLSSRNETYMTYAPTTSCTYGSLPPVIPVSSSKSTTAVLMPPTAHHTGLLLPGPSSSNLSGKPLLSNCAGNGSRQCTPPPTTIYTSMGLSAPCVSSAITMGNPIGPNMTNLSALGTASHYSAAGTPSYLTGTMVLSGQHQHANVSTLRRTLVPTSMGMMHAPTSATSQASYMPPYSTAGVPTASSVYYDSTMPRNLVRGMSTDSTQFFYG